jgi:hypothetical protein
LNAIISITLPSFTKYERLAKLLQPKFVGCIILLGMAWFLDRDNSHANVRASQVDYSSKLVYQNNNYIIACVSFALWMQIEILELN